MKYILSIDQGTTGTRAMLFDKHGKEIAKAYEEHEQIFPKPGWVEHSPLEIWQKTLSVIKESVQAANIDYAAIESIGITNQRETVVAWDKKSDMPLHNAIVWQCRRTSKMCTELKEKGHEKLFQSKTGLVLDPYFSGTKIKWLLDHNKKIKNCLKKGDLAVGTIDSWLIWQLTGEHVTEHSNASRTLLYNIHNCSWDDELLELLDVPRSILPEIHPSSDPNFYGFTKKELFGIEIPVSGCAGDQQAALFGQNCFKAGEVKNTYGTGNFLLMNTGKEAVSSDSGLLTTVAWNINNETYYALEGSIFNTGSVIQWLEKGLRVLENKEKLVEVMNTYQDTKDVYFVPAFAGLGAPYWDPYARGTLMGITGGTSREHVIRAALESIVYQSQDVFDVMEKDSDLSIKLLRVDGGVTNCEPVLQFQADISNVTVQKPVVSETTALGAAYLAGLATGYWENLDDIKSNFLIECEYSPKMDKDEVKTRLNRWKQAVERAKGWAQD